MSCTMTVNHSNSYTVLRKSLQLMISVVYVAVVQLVTWRRFLWSWAVNLPSSSSATATWTKQWEWWEKTTSVKSYRCKVIVVLSLLCVCVDVAGHELCLLQQGRKLYCCRPAVCWGVHSWRVHQESGTCFLRTYWLYIKACELLLDDDILVGFCVLRLRKSRRWRLEILWIAPQITDLRTTRLTWTSWWSTVSSAWRRGQRLCMAGDRWTDQVRPPI